MKKRHQLPINEIEGLNLDEKETRHDIDKKINKLIDARNRLPSDRKNFSE